MTFVQKEEEQIWIDGKVQLWGSPSEYFSTPSDNWRVPKDGLFWGEGLLPLSITECRWPPDRISLLGLAVAKALT